MSWALWDFFLKISLFPALSFPDPEKLIFPNYHRMTRTVSCVQSSGNSPPSASLSIHSKKFNWLNPFREDFVFTLAWNSKIFCKPSLNYQLGCLPPIESFPTSVFVITTTGILPVLTSVWLISKCLFFFPVREAKILSVKTRCRKCSNLFQVRFCCFVPVSNAAWSDPLPPVKYTPTWSICDPLSSVYESR